MDIDSLSIKIGGPDPVSFHVSGITLVQPQISVVPVRFHEESETLPQVSAFPLPVIFSPSCLHVWTDALQPGLRVFQGQVGGRA